MNKKVLILNSSLEHNPFLLDFILELQNSNYDFLILSQNSSLFTKKAREHRVKIKNFWFGPKICSKGGVFFGFLYLPFLFFYLFVFSFLKFKYKVKTIVCLDWNEKIIFTSLANLFKIKVVWIEEANFNYRSCSGFFINFIQRLSKKVNIVTFVRKNKIQLKSLGFSENRIFVLRPGIKLMKAPQHQDSIFSEIAKKENLNYNQKYFTVGLVTDFAYPNQIETLLHAIKICKSVISNIQLIIVGEGEAKKQVAWSAKKMDLDKITWLVGHQENLKKWLDSFDLYVAASEKAKLSDLKLLLKAMDAGLPVLSFSSNGFDEFVFDDVTGRLVENGDIESLSQAILNLYNNKLLLNKLGENAKEFVAEKFNINQQAEKFIKYIS